MCKGQPQDASAPWRKLTVVAVACCLRCSTLAPALIATSGGGACVQKVPRPRSADDAIERYQKSLRGAVKVQSSEVTPAVLRLARLNDAAWSFRHRGDFDRASACYRRSIQQCESLSCVSEVPRAAVAAHAALNLALSVQKQPDFENARHEFQRGAEMVQRLIRMDFGAFVDGQSRLHLLTGAESNDSLNKALQWLATLLTAWALFERKQGRKNAARSIAQRASAIDTSKAPVLRWKLMQVDA